MDLRGWVRSERQEFRDLFERTVLQAIPREQLSIRPGGTGNSIVWLMWHLARVEDVAIHVIVRGQPQVLTSPWLDRLNVAEYRVGTGFSEEEVEALSRSIDVEAVDGYWQAVRQATDEWFSAVSLDELDAVPDVDARLKAIPEIVGELPPSWSDAGNSLAPRNQRPLTQPVRRWFERPTGGSGESGQGRGR